MRRLNTRWLSGVGIVASTGLLIGACSGDAGDGGDDSSGFPAGGPGFPTGAAGAPFAGSGSGVAGSAQAGSGAGGTGQAGSSQGVAGTAPVGGSGISGAVGTSGSVNGGAAAGSSAGGSSGSGAGASLGGSGVGGSNLGGLGGKNIGGASGSGGARAGSSNGGSSSGAGSSAGGSCSGGKASCGNACVDTQTDEANCGQCSKACATGSTCNNGSCSAPPTPTTGCTTIGANTTVNATIIVKSGETYDGQCKRFIAGSALGDGSQDEDQKPVFRVEGGTLINVVLGAPAADGIHTYGNATLRNITWQDVGEDALTIKESGTVTLDGGSASDGEDKIFQVNAASTFRISNFKASNGGKFIRQNGGTTYKVAVFIDKCDISRMSEAIFRTDSSSSTVSMTNTRYSEIGESLFIGVSAGNITQSNNTQY